MGAPTITAPPPSATSTPKPTLTPTTTATPTVTPTPQGGGGLIAFSSNPIGQYDIFTIFPDGSGLQRLTDSLLEDQYPAWSPDGSWIAFTSGGKTSSFDLWLMRGNGSELHRLVKGNVSWPTWSPDSSSIAMVYYLNPTTIENERDRLYLAAADGTGQRLLRVSEPHGGWSSPAWSPDGDVIAVAPYLEPGTVTGEIYLMYVDSGALTRVTNSPGDDFDPSWSPDGRQLAFSSNRDGNWEIYLIDRDGSGEMRLTNHFAWDWQPTWSPDGRRIAFASNRSGNFDIYVLELETGEVVRLTDGPGDEVAPDWSYAPGIEPVALTTIATPRPAPEIPVGWQVAQHNELSIGYPETWETTEATGEQACIIRLAVRADPDVNLCILVLGGGETPDVKAAEGLFWEGLLTLYRFLGAEDKVEVISVDSIEISGYPAVRRVYRGPGLQFLDLRFHKLHVVWATPEGPYVISVTAPGDTGLDPYRAEINAMIATLQVTP